MQFIKRIFLFLLTNIAVLVVLNIVILIVQTVFGINISAYGLNLQAILMFAFIFGFSGALVSLFMSKWTAKRAYNIQILEIGNLSSKEQTVYNLVRDIANKNGISMPEVGVYQASELNAFATGATKNSSLVAVSSGLLQNMNEKEVEGVIAHEMAHIINGDMVTMTLLQGVINTFVIFIARVVGNIADSATKSDSSNQNSPGAIYYIVSMILELVLSLLASLIVMWFSRYREYRADEGSAKFVGKEKMIAALQALKRTYEVTPADGMPLSTYKISARSGGFFSSLFASHPSLDKRISNLENFRI